MAVDANILIYERIREELRSGKTPRIAIDLGFGKALSSIIDGNMTTMLTAFVLMHKLREDSWGKTVSIIILSNYDTSDTHLFQIILDEPAFYLVKSNVSLDLIFEKLKEVVETKNKAKMDGGTSIATAVTCLCFMLQSGVKLG
jgi:hypothetical protein